MTKEGKARMEEALAALRLAIHQLAEAQVKLSTLKKADLEYRTAGVIREDAQQLFFDVKALKGTP